ncbi:MAG: haloacid dehalogenase type II [Myxococcales bacterium]|nr:haloacid dehalogenase type II [Myxococcales bacterium]
MSDALRLLSRRSLIECLSLASASASCANTSALATRGRAARPAVRAVAFDLFTLFDPRRVAVACEAHFPSRGAEVAARWRARQFEYAFVHQAAEHYRDFRSITAAALEHTLASSGLELDRASREALVAVYEQLELWPDTRGSLASLRARGLRLAPLANYTPRMLEALLDRSQLRGAFDQLLSTDRARALKPSPRAYQLAVDAFGLARNEIAFAAFGPWDAAGAAWFGFRTFWMNRLGIVGDLFGAEHATGRNFADFDAWL